MIKWCDFIELSNFVGTLNSSVFKIFSNPWHKICNSRIHTRILSLSTSDSPRYNSYLSPTSIIHREWPTGVTLIEYKWTFMGQLSKWNINKIEIFAQYSHYKNLLLVDQRITLTRQYHLVPQLHIFVDILCSSKLELKPLARSPVVVHLFNRFENGIW